MVYGASARRTEEEMGNPDGSAAYQQCGRITLKRMRYAALIHFGQLWREISTKFTA